MKELTMQDVECTLFKTAFDTSLSAPVQLSSYISCVAGGKYQQEITRVRSLLQAGDADQSKAHKRRLPLLVAGGRMEGGRKLEHLVDYSGCVVADIDNAPGSVADLLTRAKELPYVKAGHVSPSGTGLKLFVLVDSDKEHHMQAFTLVSRMVETDLPGCQVDPSGKDANRGCFVSYDPQAFFKEEAIVVCVPTCSKEDACQAAFPVGSLVNYLAKYEQGNVFTDGNRHAYVVKLASVLNNAGFDLCEVSDECTRRYVSPGFTEKEIRTTVADIYRRYQSSHGSNRYVPPTASAGTGSVKSVRSVTLVPENDAIEDYSPLGADIEDERPYFPHFKRALLSNLPDILSDAVKDAVDDTEHDLLLLGAITALSTALPKVRGMMNGDIYYPPLYTLLIGPSGSGKGSVSKIQKLVEPWQTYVADNSRHEVEEYKKKKEAYEIYKAQQRQNRAKKPVGLPPEDPKPVMLKQLHVCGYTSTARLCELLEVNAPYASFLFETELESLNSTLSQDFGGYGYVLNQAFHHEYVGTSTKSNGSSLAIRPKLGMLCTGTPAMLHKMFPSTEDGGYSRELIYRIIGANQYHELTSRDNYEENALIFENLGRRVLDAAVFLESSPTFISFSDAQRKRIDRYFSREYYNVRVFGTEDVSSVVLRHRLIIFRICMVLTALRKGLACLDERKMVIADSDFDVAFHIGTTCLNHTLMVSTTMKHSDVVPKFKIVTAQLDLFVALPDRFTTAEAITEASVRGISRSSVFRMLKKAQEYGLLIMLSAGCYEKTESGENVTNK